MTFYQDCGFAKGEKWKSDEGVHRGKHGCGSLRGRLASTLELWGYSGWANVLYKVS